MRPPRKDILGPHVVMRRHDEIGQRHLPVRRGQLRPSPFDPRQLARDAVGTQRLQQVELPAPRSFGTAIGEVDDVAAAFAR